MSDISITGRRRAGHHETRPRARQRFVMSPKGYFYVADIIRKIADPVLRQTVADHFATEFNRRSASFDPYQWERASGGKVAPNSAAKR